MATVPVKSTKPIRYHGDLPRIEFGAKQVGVVESLRSSEDDISKGVEGVISVGGPGLEIPEGAHLTFGSCLKIDGGSGERKLKVIILGKEAYPPPEPTGSSIGLESTGLIVPSTVGVGCIPVELAVEEFGAAGAWREEKTVQVVTCHGHWTHSVGRVIIRDCNRLHIITLFDACDIQNVPS